MNTIDKNQLLNNKEWNSIISELGLTDKLKKAKRIVIKPNLAAGSYAEQNSHIVSDMRLLSSDIAFFHEINKDADIFIAESDSTGYGYAFLKFENLNMPECLNLSSALSEKVHLLDLSRDRLERTNDKRFRYFNTVDNQLWLSATLLHSDFFVSLSNLKTHAVTNYTGACKNLFGCLPDSDKSKYHPYIHNVIHDLTLCLCPDLSIVDAFYGMEKNGPVQGLPINSGYRVFSDSAFEADVISSSSIGINPKSIIYLKRIGKTTGERVATSVSVVKRYKKVSLLLRLNNRIGLFFQRIGQSISSFGHRIHSCSSVKTLIITIFRPVLLKMFDYEKLKKWKRKLFR